MYSCLLEAMAYMKQSAISRLPVQRLYTLYIDFVWNARFADYESCQFSPSYSSCGNRCKLMELREIVEMVLCNVLL